MKHIVTLGCLMLALAACSNKSDKPQVQSPLMSCSPSVDRHFVATPLIETPMLAPTNHLHSNALVAMLQPAATRDQNVKP